MTRAIIAIAIAIAVGLFTSANHTRAAAADDILSRSIAAYGALKSYADTGAIVNEFAANASQRHTFTTYYRAPRQYYFEFVADQRAGAGHTVMWCDGGDFQSWSSTLGLHQTYPRGSNTVLSGFAAAGAPTLRTISLITGLLFANSGMLSTVLEFGEDYTVEGIEDVGGHRCHKLVGMARSMYAKTQRVTNVRRTIIWIDTESLLVRKVFEDTPEGSPLTAVNRTTVTLDPRANPTLEDARFTYTVPAPKR